MLKTRSSARPLKEPELMWWPAHESTGRQGLTGPGSAGRVLCACVPVCACGACVCASVCLVCVPLCAVSKPTRLHAACPDAEPPMSGSAARRGDSALTCGPTPCMRLPVECQRQRSSRSSHSCVSSCVSCPVLSCVCRVTRSVLRTVLCSARPPRAPCWPPRDWLPHLSARRGLCSAACCPAGRLSFLWVVGRGMSGCRGSCHARDAGPRVPCATRPQGCRPMLPNSCLLCSPVLQHLIERWKTLGGQDRQDRLQAPKSGTPDLIPDQRCSAADQPGTPPRLMGCV